MALLAVTGQTEGLWVILAGSGEESAAALNVRTQTGLARLSVASRVAIVTFHTPESATQHYLLSHLQTIHPSIHLSVYPSIFFYRIRKEI